MDQKPVPRYRARAETKQSVRRLVKKAKREGKPWPRDRVVQRLWEFAAREAGKQ